MTERCAVSALRSLDLSLAVQAADGIPELLPARALTIEEVWVNAHFAHFGPSIPGARAMLTVSPSKAPPRLIAVLFSPAQAIAAAVCIASDILSDNDRGTRSK